MPIGSLQSCPLFLFCESLRYISTAGNDVLLAMRYCSFGGREPPYASCLPALLQIQRIAFRSTSRSKEKIGDPPSLILESLLAFLVQVLS